MQKLEYVKQIAEIVKETKHDIQIGLRSEIEFRNKTKVQNDLQINHSKELQDLVRKRM